MAYKIAIASGKGGTGKTTVAVNLYQGLAKNGHVSLVDCDVEEPNSALFFPDKTCLNTKPIYQLIPEIDESKCLFCGKCDDWCEFNAITIIPSKQYAKVDESLCHSCGACTMACGNDAIKENQKIIGTVQTYKAGLGEQVFEGRLKVGSSMQTMMISQLKKKLTEGDGILIMDAPPGTSCQVVETVSDSDYVVLVTEPTPFGLHDLKLMVELLTQMNKAFGVVINKAGIGDRNVYNYLEKEKIKLLSEIPFNKAYASNYAKGELLYNQPKNVEDGFNKLLERIESISACEKLPY